MKYVLIIILISIGYLQGQTIPELFSEYEDHCNEIVLDTIRQMGHVEYDLLPVMDGEDILYYTLGNADTTWFNPACPLFKHPKQHQMHTMRPIEGTAFDLRPFVNNRPISNHDPAIQLKSISRQYVCQVKQCQAEGYNGAFWAWVKSKYQ
ncbi:MAG: hypothetical protein ACWA44_02365 [Thiotrichales bacterium]